MKTIKTIVAAMFATLALATVSCGGSQTKTDAQPSETEATATEQAPAGVVVLADDNLLRPGKELTRIAVLDFNASWCIPCKKLAPAFEKAAEEYGDKVDFYSVDIDNNPLTKEAFDIETVPVVYFMLPNGEVRRFDGLGNFISDDEIKLTADDKDAATAVIYNNLVQLLQKEGVQ